MKTPPISATNLSKSLLVDSNLQFTAPKDQWLDNLTAGQILKGRVLKSYGGQKYGVLFGGQERIVDSAVPLSVGAEFSGKISQINDGRVSMRIVDSVLPNNQNTVKQAPPKTELQVQAMRFGVQLNQMQEAVILSVAKRSASPALTVNIGLYLLKLGLHVSKESLEMLTRRFLADSDSGAVYDEALEVPLLELQDSINQPTLVPINETLEKLKNYLLDTDSDVFDQHALEKSDEFLRELDAADQGDSRSKSGGGDAFDWERIFQHLLNVDTDAAVKHQYKTFPVVINGQLREFSLALFDQASDKEGGDGNKVKSKAIKLSLETDSGQLDLDARLVNDRVQLGFYAENHHFLSRLSANQDMLVNQLNEAGWQLDDVNFTNGMGDQGPAKAILRHVLEQGSLNIEA